jgi:hypothetical protein
VPLLFVAAGAIRGGANAGVRDNAGNGKPAETAQEARRGRVRIGQNATALAFLPMAFAARLKTLIFIKEKDTLFG